MVGRRPRLAGQPCPAPVARAIVDDCLTLIDALDPIVARLQRDLRARAKPDPASPPCRCSPASARSPR